MDAHDSNFECEREEAHGHSLLFQNIVAGPY